MPRHNYTFCLAGTWKFKHRCKQGIPHFPGFGHRMVAAQRASQRSVRHVLIIDRYPIFLHGLTASLQACGVTVYDPPKSATDTAVRVKPGVLLVGITRIQDLADQKVQYFRRKYPEANVLAIISEGELALTERLFKHGALGCISRRRGIEEFLKAIDAVGNSEIYFDREAANEILRQFHPFYQPDRLLIAPR